MLREPWSDIGRLQSDIRDLQNKLGQFAQSYELTPLQNNIRNLQDENSSLRRDLDDVRSAIDILREEVERLYGKLEEK